ncbi:hypothetical protein SAMN05880566_1012 [Janthinobacterium sp. TND4EL3]|nr:hypothetical protein SAMN05880566_1012 [Janthinobacterium sp. TND4EL3]
MKHFAKSVNSFFLLPSPFPVIPLFRKLLRLIGEANYSKAPQRKQGFSGRIASNCYNFAPSAQIRVHT